MTELTEMGAAALALARAGWQVLPLAGKAPAIRGGRGVLDATVDVDQVAAWWSGPYRGCNVGARVPERLVVIDVDPRAGGADSLAALTRTHGRLPSTLSVWSGRGDGGRHYYYRRPPGELSAARLGPGIDLKTCSGYVVVPPSRHPDTGEPYRRAGGPTTPAVTPGWLAALLRPPVAPPRAARAATGGGAALVRYVAGLEPGRRNDGLYWACCRVVEQRLGDHVLKQLVHAAVSTGLPEAEARRTAHSAARRLAVAS